MLSFIVLLLSIIQFNLIDSTDYVIKRDYFLGFKAPEYSVFNASEEHLYYRLESKYDFQHNVKLVEYPSKKTIGQVRSKKQGDAYEGKLSIRNSTTKEWSVGTIVQHSQWFTTNYSIDLNEYHLSLIKLVASSRTDLINRTNGFRLAQYHRRWISRSFKYDMKIFSDDVPESIILLSFSVACRGSNG